MIDVIGQINAVRRQVGHRALEAGEGRTVTVSQSYPTGLADLWDACTDADRISRWFLPVSGELRLGGHYQLDGNAGGTIERCNPPHSFGATWEYDGAVSWIEVRLTAESASLTRFELEHLLPVDAKWAEFGPGAVGIGWELAMSGLGLHLPTGLPMDPSEAAAWMVSTEARQFVTLSGRRWCEMQLAAGIDPEAAGSMADRTIAAYTAAPDPAPDSASA
jgi:uncharacterized protein YndB with AHSA1/START domain